MIHFVPTESQIVCHLLHIFEQTEVERLEVSEKLNSFVCVHRFPAKNEHCARSRIEE